MKIKIEDLITIRREYRQGYKSYANGILKDIYKKQYDLDYIDNYSIISSLLRSILDMDLEDILFEAGIFSTEAEIEL